MKRQISLAILLLIGLIHFSVFAYELKVETFPTGAGNLRGGGSYDEGTEVWIETWGNTGFQFVGWFDGSDRISQDSNFRYIMPQRDVTLTARYEFKPDSPADPSMPDTARSYSLKAKVMPEGAGWINLAEGKYKHGEQVGLSTSANTGFVFRGWYEGDEQLSSNNSYYFDMPARNVELTARYEFSPASPGDPLPPAIKYPLTILCQPESGGSVSPVSGGTYAEGETINLWANLNYGFVFDGWEDSVGGIISTSRSYTITMPAAPMTLTARFRFSPDNPSDPDMSAPTRNLIYGNRETAYPGVVASVKVNLENSDPIKGIDIDVMLPEGVVFDLERATPTDRAAAHTLSIEPLAGKGMWHISLRGDENFQGANGALIRVPVSIPAEAELGMIYNIGLTNGFIYREDGSREAVAVRDGQLKVAQKPDVLPDSPDFCVASVSADAADVMPEDVVTFSWTVRNDGNIGAVGGWSESLYLADSNGKRVMLGTVFYDGAGLAAGETVARTATLKIPRLPGLSGRLNPVVTLVPYLASDEIPQLQANNTSSGDGFPITLGKRLILTLPEIVTEGNDINIRGQLARSGSWDENETFTLTSIEDDPRLSIPETVIIPREQSATWFQMSLDRNDIANPVAYVRLSAEGDGYDKTEATMSIQDSQLPVISLSIDKDDVKEGESATLTATLPYPIAMDLILDLASAPATRISLPATISIPAGETVSSVTLTATDNDIVDGHQEVTIIASAAGFGKGSAYLYVIDDEMPELHMQLSPAEVNENAGVMAVRGEITRTTNIDKRVTLMLTANVDDQVIFPIDRIVLDAGVKTTEFSVAVIDNDIVDGDRDIEITAAVYISSCSCSSAGGLAGSVASMLHIIDDDGPSLGLTAPTSVVAEGDRNGVEVTLRRNAQFDEALTVNLSCDTPGALEMPESVVIKKGAEKVSFKVTVPVNDVPDDDRTVVLSAQAEGFATSNLWMMVTDRTLPDARLSSISVAEKEVVAGGTTDVTLSLTSCGVVPLPAQTAIAIYVDGEIATRIWLQDFLPVGVNKEFVRSITLPSRAGNCDIYAVANYDKAIKELNYSDNRSSTVTLRLLSPFKAGIELSSHRIAKGEKVGISGHLDSASPAGEEVEIYVINDGLRMTQKAIADAEGHFETFFTPYATQSGHFAVGACCPGEGLTEEMASFEIVDLRRVNNSFITCDAIAGTPSSVAIGIMNPCGIDMSGITVNAINLPEGVKITSDAPSLLKAGEKGNITLSLNGTKTTEGSDWECFSVTITSNEGASLEIPVYWYCRNATGTLASDVTLIEAELPQDRTIEYPLTISNKGAGDTGTIEVVLPEWMKCAGPLRLPSLAPNESIVITLLMKPTAEMPLNLMVNGQLAVNCENGNGIAIKYSVMPVSDQPAKLELEACDEYTYNTAEAPRVVGAKVSVVNPGNGLKVSEGITDEHGVFSAEFPAGYYRMTVSADRHDSWSGTVFLNPGKTNRVTANISFNPISITYTVVPTEVEDEYEIETTAKFEVNVPAPVVHVTVPSKIDGDDMEVGESTVIDVNLTNEGLMTAYKVSPVFDDGNPDWIFESLDHKDPFDLLPNQTVRIPVRLFKVKHPDSDSGNCKSYVAARYLVLCGDTIWKLTQSVQFSTRKCPEKPLGSTAPIPVNWSGNGGPIGPAGGGWGSSSGAATDYPVGYEQDYNICDPCDAIKYLSLKDSGFNKDGDWKIFWDITGTIVSEHKQQESKVLETVVRHTTDSLVTTVSTLKLIDTGYNPSLTTVVDEISKACEEEDSIPVFKRDWQEVFYNEAQKFKKGWKTIEFLYSYIFGDASWMLDPSEDKIVFMQYVASLRKGTVVSDEELALRKPESVTLEQAREYIDRVGGVKDVSSLYENELRDAIETLATIDEEAKKSGFENGADRFIKAYESYKKEFDNLNGNSVCASVALRFSQTTTMTREAFRGTLEVFNGHDNTPMRDVRLNLTVTNKNDDLATSHEFQINPESLTGFKGELDLLAGWELDAGERGVAEIIFIPTRYAAPQGPEVWDFGGSLTYIDPFTDLEVTRKLQAVSVTVNPTPVLDLTYFLQRDVYSDDPLTPDVVEQSEAAEFALVISNSGVGDAKNVRLITQQPQIVDNEKGILLDTSFTSSQLNGSDRHLSLGGSMASEFGDIPAGTSSYAQWWFESSLAGHFIDYDVKVTHVSSYGNPDLSLLGDVEIHELIRGITDPASIGDNPRRIFLANDIVDADDLPDMVYYSDASQETTLGSAIISSEMIDRYTYRLNVQPLSPGWVYGSIDDPTGGRMRLVSITRVSDGKELPVDNFWQTYMTMRDGSKPIHETIMHVAVDTYKAESYKLVFEARPSGVLEVSEISGLPLDNAEPFDPIKSLTVSFTMEVDMDSFTSDALRLTRGGERVDLSEIKIESISPETCNVEFGAATDYEGYYVFTADASRMFDMEGYEGRNGKSVAWLQKGESIDAVTSIIEDSKDFSISPIPVRDVITLTGRFNQIVRLGIYDTAGTLVGQWSGLKPDYGSECNTVRVDVREIPSGVMIVTAITDSGVIFSRRVLFITD